MRISTTKLNIDLSRNQDRFVIASVDEMELLNVISFKESVYAVVGYKCDYAFSIEEAKEIDPSKPIEINKIEIRILRDNEQMNAYPEYKYAGTFVVSDPVNVKWIHMMHVMAKITKE